MKIANINFLLFSIVLGLAVGVGFFTFVYARGYSYMTNDPAACANCHVMDDYYSAWQKASHHTVAVCNDCHTPHNFVGKYLTKASNGFWHSFAFTTGDFPDPMRIKPHNREITNETCQTCHEDIVASIVSGPHITGRGTTRAINFEREDEQLSCIRCHSTVGHMVR